METDIKITTYSFSYRTIFADLDTQHHVNSNRYFDLFESGKYLLLDKLGILKEFLFNKQIMLEPCLSNFKFIKQVVDNENIDVTISLSVFKDGYFKWTAEMISSDSVCFRICSVNKISPTLPERLIAENDSFNETLELFNLKTNNNKIYSSTYQFRNIERNYFGNIPENMSWKLFEETRWNHSASLNVTFNVLKELDIAFFWRVGEYRFSKVFNSSEYIKSNIWLEKVEDFKLTYAHEILNTKNEIICNSISTFIPVSISKKKPKRIPLELINLIKDYIK
jgi:acyl-CoA thioesterase FadM